jgi:tRNA(Ile2) C34 agmatinyltransferase TiaS
MTDRLADLRDDDQVLACDECGSTSLNTAGAAKYRCTTCGRMVDEPVERDAENDTEPGNKGAGKDLADADPDAWP